MTKNQILDIFFFPCVRASRASGRRHSHLRGYFSIMLLLLYIYFYFKFRFLLKTTLRKRGRTPGEQEEEGKKKKLRSEVDGLQGQGHCQYRQDLLILLQTLTSDTRSLHLRPDRHAESRRLPWRTRSSAKPR